MVFIGRGVAIYQEVHGMSTKEKRYAKNSFLEKLRLMLDDDARPIMVTNAGCKIT